MKGHKRTSLRAPHTGTVLYRAGEYVFKCESKNISGGGILLGALPFFPEDKVIPMMISLPLFPMLGNLNLAELKELGRQRMESSIFRVKGEVVREYSGDRVEKVFTSQVGVEFFTLSEEAHESIDKYIEVFVKNIVHLLGLFEKNEGGPERISLVSMILGYQEEKFSLLRQKILHDYQSLEGL